MKKFLVGMLVISNFYYSQVGINTSSPDPSSDLTLGASNKGLLLNRVSLQSSTDIVTIANPATGLFVYNTGTGGLTPKGAYFWNGSEWTGMITSTGSPTDGMQIGEEKSFLIRVPGTIQNGGTKSNDWKIGYKYESYFRIFGKSFYRTTSN